MSSSNNIFDPNESVPTEPPPSYEEAIHDMPIPVDGYQTQQGALNTAQQQQPVPPQRPQLLTPPLPSRPPATAPRPSNGQTSSHASRPASPANSSSSQNSADLYTANLDLPWRYPKGYVCKKCYNKGYRKGKKCKHCWSIYGPQSSSQSANAGYPGTYAASYHQSHQQRPQQAQQAPQQQQYQPIQGGVVQLPPGQIVAAGGPGSPLVVQPGDPRIGGVICWRCGGRGQVYTLLFDREMCSVCHGTGRILTPTL